MTTIKEDILKEAKDLQVDINDPDGLVITYSFLSSSIDRVEQEYAHPTKDGYCCACEYDIACLEQKLKAQRQEIIEEIRRDIDLHITNFPHITLESYKMGSTLFNPLK